LKDAAERVGKIGQVGHMMRHADPIRIAAEIAQSPEFGRVLSVESKYTTWPTAQMAPGAGWGEPSADWTYMLIQGCHPIDLMRHFLGEIARVSAFKSSGAGNTKVYQVALESHDGRAGFLNLQDSYNGWTTGLEIVGDGQGIVRVDDLGRVSYRRGEKRTKPKKRPIGATALICGSQHHRLTDWRRAVTGTQLQEWARCIR
jgi:predicted dehydrogenase